MRRGGHSASPFPRRARLESVLVREIALWIQRHVEPPFGDHATVTRLVLSRDLSHADVFVLTHGDSVAPQDLVEELARHVGRLQGDLGRTLRIKRVPKLAFRYDRPYEEAARVEGMIAHLHDADEPAEESES